MWTILSAAKICQ